LKIEGAEYSFQSTQQEKYVENRGLKIPVRIRLITSKLCDKVTSLFRFKSVWHVRSTQWSYHDKKGIAGHPSDMWAHILLLCLFFFKRGNLVKIITIVIVKNC